jgi:hypothetical protein
MRRGLGAALAIAMLGALIAATGAAALKTKSASTEIESGESGSATAKCKRGSEAVSGGFDAATNAEVIESSRAGKREWTAAGRAGGGGATFTVSAYCDKSEPGLKTKATEVPIDPDGLVVSATAKCKRGTEAVSGAFESESDGAPPVTASSRVGKRRWRASGLVFANSPGTFRAVAYCDKSEPGLKTKTATAKIDSFAHGSATAKCKRGTEAVSGGFASPEPEVLAAGFPGPAVVVLASTREGKRRWTASGFAGFGGGTLTAYAYCEKR